MIEDKMLLSGQLLEALDFSESIIVLTDISGAIQYANKTFFTTYGYTSEEVIGKNPPEQGKNSEPSLK